MHTGIALNTVMFVGFYIAGDHKMSLIAFLSACAFWLNLILRQRNIKDER